MTEQSELPAVEIQFITRNFRQPPIVDLLFNIKLQNPHTEARWFLLPATLDSFAISIGEGGINALEIFKLDGQGSVIVGRFLGNAGFQALRLPANAEVNLRRFPISLWEQDVVDSVQVEVVIAHGFTIGGELAEAWFGMDPTSAIRADVTEEKALRLGSKQTSELEDLPVSLTKEYRIRLDVDLVADEVRSKA